MKTLLSLIALAGFATACQHTRPAVGQHEQGNVSHKKAGNPRIISQIIKDRFPMQVVASNPTDVAAQTIVAKTEGKLAQAGYNITPSTKPFFKIFIKSQGQEKGKFGKYTRYEVTADASLNRNTDGKLLARNSFTDGGKREASLDKAMRASAESISQQVAIWAESQSDKAKHGMQACVLTIDMSEYEDSIFGSNRYLGNHDRDLDLAKSITRFTKRSNAVKGIVDCQLIETVGDKYSFRIIYLESVFPNGITSRSIGKNDVQLYEEDPLDILIHIIYNSKQ